MTKNKIELWLSSGIKKNFMHVLIMLLFLLSGIWSAINYQHDKMFAPTQPASINRVIRVEVNGAVLNPGIYMLDVDGRVYEAIAAAGGLTPGADTRGMNLAEHLYNGQRLEIPHLNPYTSPPPTGIPTLLGNERMESPPLGLIDGKESATISPTSTFIGNTCPEPATGRGVFMWPVDAHFLTGNDFSPDHPGIDIAAGVGSPVYAADSGMIRLAGNDDTGYGNLIEIDHGNDYSTVYAHLIMIEVKVCRNVYAGQRIGLAGNTGNASGAHLHFEVIHDGEYIDPWSVLPTP